MILSYGDKDTERFARGEDDRVNPLVKPRDGHDGKVKPNPANTLRYKSLPEN